MSTYYAQKEITGRVKSVAFDSGRIDLADKEKTVLFCPSSLLLSLCKEIMDRPILTFVIDGKIVVSFRQHSYEEAK